MFAPLPLLIRDYSVIQVAIANGSSRPCEFKPDGFSFQRGDSVPLRGMRAHDIVREFMRSGGRDDVVKLVTAYETSLYGMSRRQSTNGYEQRRQAAIAEVESTKLKAAAAASAIVLVQMKLKPGESTDGAVFFRTQGKPLGPGTLIVDGAGGRFLFEHAATH
jgi:hypothetical protein